MPCTCSSCAQRSRWTPKERAAFDRDDLADEADEMACGNTPFLLAPLPDYWDPQAQRNQRRSPDLTGQRFGRLLVLAAVIRERRCTDRTGGPRTINARDWAVRCDCGHEYVTRAQHLQAGRQCARCAGRERGERMCKSVDGLRVVEAAQRAGLNPNAVWHRIRRGYPRALWFELPHSGSARRREAGRIAA
jgi:hypothetical protein